MLRADVCFKVFHNSDCAQEQQRSQYARNRGQRRAGTAPKRKAPEAHPWKSQLLAVLAVPAGHSPVPPSAAIHPQPCASLTCCLLAPSEKHSWAFSPTVQLLALAHCLRGTKTDFLLPFPFSKTNKLECFKSEAFIRPLVYHRSLVAAVLSSKSCVCDPPKRHLVLTAACRELEKPLHSLRFVQG